MSSKDPLDVEDPLDELPTASPLFGVVPELMRKAAFAGLGALFMTEEGLRRTAAQIPLPKEALAGLQRRVDELAVQRQAGTRRSGGRMAPLASGLQTRRPAARRAAVPARAQPASASRSRR